MFAVLLTLSACWFPFANSFSLLLIGRACLGLALEVVLAMSVRFTHASGAAYAEGAVGDLRRGFYCAVIAAPLGALGELIGWRNVFNAHMWICRDNYQIIALLPGEPRASETKYFPLGYNVRV